MFERERVAAMTQGAALTTRLIELAPLTVLFGANSSGKSSLHQFLLMLRQTVESSDRKRVLHTGDAATPVDLGSYSELVRNADLTVPLEFELNWRRPTALEIFDPLPDRSQVTADDLAARVSGAGIHVRARAAACGDRGRWS